MSRVSETNLEYYTQKVKDYIENVLQTALAEAKAYTDTKLEEQGNDVPSAPSDSGNHVINGNSNGTTLTMKFDGQILYIY